MQWFNIISVNQLGKESKFHSGKGIQEWSKWNLWKTALKNLKWYGHLKQTILPYHFKVFNSCIPQILLGQLLNNMTQFLQHGMKYFKLFIFLQLRMLQSFFRSIISSSFSLNLHSKGAFNTEKGRKKLEWL